MAISRIGGEIQVNTATTGDQIDPRVVTLSNGTFVITWEDRSGDGSGTAVKAQVFAADGTSIGNQILVNTATPRRTCPRLLGYVRSAFSRRVSSAACASSQARNAAIFGSAAVARGQTIQ